MLGIFENKLRLCLVLALGASHANSNSKIPMYFTDLENCTDGSDQHFDIAPGLFQQTDSLQLRTNTRKNIPRLSLSEFVSAVPLESNSNLRGSIAGMDIKDHAKMYTDVFDRERDLKPDVVIEGLLGKDGAIANLSIKKLRKSVKAIALRSKEAVDGNLSVTALDGDGAPVAEYNYTPYQIVYLKTESGYEERFVNVSTQTCSEDTWFVSRLGTNIIRHDRDSLPFRIFLSVSESVHRLSISFNNSTTELAIPRLAGL